MGSLQNRIGTSIREQQEARKRATVLLTGGM